MTSKGGLRERVVAVCEQALETRGQITAVDVMVGLGWIHRVNVERWRWGTGRPLEPLAVPLDRILQALVHVAEWATEHGLVPVEARYVGTDRIHTPLRFMTDDDEDVEKVCRTHWVRPEAGLRAAESPAPAGVSGSAGRRGRVDDILVIEATREWTCAECSGTGAFLRMDGGGPICMDCADLGHLEFLPRGDTALTRRARSGSALSAIVVRWSRSRKRYERQGVLVEPEALERAEEQCLADAELRERRRVRAALRRETEDTEYQAELADAIRQLFPGCPPARAAAIARHAGERSSGRVGRTAGAKAFDLRMIELAVVASVRHLDTNYDELLMTGVPRADARDRIRGAVDVVLHRWRIGGHDA